MKAFTARLPLDLYNKIKKASKENNRSVMGEITHRLIESFKTK